MSIKIPAYCEVPFVIRVFNAGIQLKIVEVDGEGEMDDENVHIFICLMASFCFTKRFGSGKNKNHTVQLSLGITGPSNTVLTSLPPTFISFQNKMNFLLESD